MRADLTPDGPACRRFTGSATVSVALPRVSRGSMKVDLTPDGAGCGRFMERPGRRHSFSGGQGRLPAVALRRLGDEGGPDSRRTSLSPVRGERDRPGRSAARLARQHEGEPDSRRSRLSPVHGEAWTPVLLLTR